MMTRVLLGMSGGIDSSVSAMILKDQGYEVVGLTLRLWDKEHINDQVPDYIQKAIDLAHSLKIEHHILDIRDDFKDKVINYFLEEYEVGRTPNACAFCNPEIKWRSLLEASETYNCEYIATGHYVQKQERQGLWYLKKGADPIKDQSYFLWDLKQENLKRTLFPLGGYTKQQIREYALSKGFQQLDKQKESMGVCFLQDVDYRSFLQDSFKNAGKKLVEGEIVDENGGILGRHDGIPFYTIGQKKGLDIQSDLSFYVSEMNAEKNQLIVGSKQSLKKSVLWIEQPNVINPEDLNNDLSIRTIIRGYGLNPQGYSTVEIIAEDLLKVSLDEQAWAPAPGQPVAFYIDDILIGGGILRYAE